MLTKNEFMKKLKEARASQLLIERRMNEIFSNYNLDAMPFSASNSDNLEEAIQCYIHYGEMPLSENLDDFWESYKKSVPKESE
jgi:hypothetical protein